MKTNTIIWVVVAFVVLVGGYALVMNTLDETAAPAQPGTSLSSPITSTITQIEPVAPSDNTYLSTALMTEQNDSGQSGTAIFSQNLEGDVVVTIELVGAQSALAQPAHIHIGECPNPGEVKYTLTNVVGGKSETVLDTTWAEFLTGEEALAVNVHKSTDEPSIYYACGNISLATSTSEGN